MPRPLEELQKAAKSYKANKSGVRLHPSQSSAGFDTRNQRRSGGILGVGGAVWEMAAASVHGDLLLDSEECHDRASH